MSNFMLGKISKKSITKRIKEENILFLNPQKFQNSLFNTIIKYMVYTTMKKLRKNWIGVKKKLEPLSTWEQYNHIIKGG